MTCSVAYRLSFTATTQIMNLKIREKISGLLILYFFIALVAIGSTLLVSWKLEGGAAAINDAGRERMRSYRIAYLLEQYSQNPSFDLRKKIETEVADFSDSLIELDLGNPSRPLLLPKDTKVKRQMKELREVWRFKIYPDILTILNETDPTKQKSLLTNYRSLIEAYVLKINELVSMVELSNAHATGLLRFLQVALVSLALIGTILLIFMFSKMVVNPMLVLTEGIQRMTNADFSVRLPVTSRDEFGDLAAGFNRMAGELQDLYATLEQRVAEKTRSIEIKNRELAALDKEMAISQERNLLAQELHDSIAQSLAFLNIQVQLLQDDLQHGHKDEALRSLSQIREGVQESYDDVRELLVHFRTRVGVADIETALSCALEKFEEQTKIKTSFKHEGKAPEMSPEQTLQIMHIVQEALSNIRKHSKASLVRVELRCTAKGVIDIIDNGIGFDFNRDAGTNHVGLRIMQERAKRIGAELSFFSAPDSGTRVCLVLPVRIEHGLPLSV